MQFDGPALAIDNDDYVESSDIFSHFFTKHFVLDKKKKNPFRVSFAQFEYSGVWK